MLRREGLGNMELNEKSKCEEMYERPQEELPAQPRVKLQQRYAPALRPLFDHVISEQPKIGLHKKRLRR